MHDIITNYNQYNFSLFLSFSLSPLVKTSVAAPWYTAHLLTFPGSEVKEQFPISLQLTSLPTSRLMGSLMRGFNNIFPLNFNSMQVLQPKPEKRKQTYFGSFNFFCFVLITMLHGDFTVCSHDIWKYPHQVCCLLNSIVIIFLNVIGIPKLNSIY